MPEFEPMGVGGILDRTFKMYKQNFVRFITIIAVVQVPIALIGFFLQTGVQAAQTAQNLGLIIGLGILTWLLMVAAQQLGTGALIKSVSESYLGNDVGVGEAYRFVLPRVLTLIGAAILVGLVTMAGFVMLIVPGIIFSLWFSLTSQAVVIEEVGATKGMSRSRALARGNLGKIFGVMFLAGLIALVINMVFQGIGGVLVAKMVSTATTPGAVPAGPRAVAQIFGLFGNVLSGPIMAVPPILLYYDLRIRKEGFDLEMLAKSLGAGDAATDFGQTI